MSQQARTLLLETLRRDAFRRGTFRLTSGRESDFFIDCKPVVLRAQGHAWVGAALLDLLRETGVHVDAVAGVELGGCSLASAVALESLKTPQPLDAVYVRKSAKGHGTGRRLEGANHLRPGARILLTEDTVTTGGSTLRAVEALRDAGFEVPLVLAIVDRSEGGADAIRAGGIRFASLYARRDFMGDES